MAKAATATANKGKAATPPPAGKGKEVALKTQGTSELDEAAQAELMKMYAEDSGKGVSTAVEDNIVPLIYILQSNSPQVQKKGDQYVDGAEAGSIWFRGTKTVVPGDEGILVSPVHKTNVWIEWMPNRGGFVGRHGAERPKEAVQKVDPQNPKKKFWALPNGNHVVETREHVVIVLGVFDSPQAFVVPMSGSGHGASRKWNTAMKAKTVPNIEPPLPAPSYSFLWRMKLEFRTNDQGDWFMWDIVEGGEDETELMLSDVGVARMARQLQKDFESGAKKADIATPDQVDDRADTEGAAIRSRQGQQEHI